MAAHRMDMTSRRPTLLLTIAHPAGMTRRPSRAVRP
jgi:hypothetical protein